MLTTPRLSLLALGVALFAEPTAQAQGAPQAPGGTAGPVVRVTASALRADKPPAIDGNLDDEVWRQAIPLDTLIQNEPAEGQPATERTEVRLLYDDNYFYVGIICFDADPSQIVVTDARRDAELNDQDSVRIIFDTYRDRQNGFLFGTNAAGIQYDAQVRNEGESPSNALVSGSGGGVNANWNATWDVQVRVTNVGWVSEFRIPLRTLRYGPPPQVWGLNINRNIRRKREMAYWSPVTRGYSILRLSLAGELRDLQLKAPRNLKLLPYVIASANTPYTTSNVKTSVDRDWGFDTKFGITPSVNLDLTYNTDFAQVEADTQQINLTRLNLVFPEKRPFFLENAGLFAVGKPGELDLFYSRRIGIASDSSLVPIRGGVRLSGKSYGTDIGIMNMQTRAVGANPANNFTALRVSRELPSRSRIGGIFTSRVATGEHAGANNWGRTWGIDGKLGVGDTWTLTGFGARTETPGVKGGQHAFVTGLEYNNRVRREYLEYTVVANNFKPEVGFIEQPGGYRQFQVGTYERVRTESLRRHGFRELYPHVNFFRYWDYTSNSLLTSRLHMDFSLDWENGFFFSPTYNIDWDGLDRPFTVYPGVVVPPGVYMQPQTAWQVRTDQRRWISANFGWVYGGFLSGHQNTMTPRLNIRKGAKLQTSLTWERRDIELPQGAFVTNLGNFRVTYNFSTNVSTQSLIQYNDRTNRWSTNLRFSWLDAAGTGLFLVYNDTEGLKGLGPVNRAFVVKLSRQVDVLH